MSLTQEPLIGGFFIKSAVFTNVNDRFFYARPKTSQTSLSITTPQKTSTFLMSWKNFSGNGEQYFSI